MDKMFRAPKGRNGRHYQRQHLSGVLLTFRQQLAAEFASRNCYYAAGRQPRSLHCPRDRGVHYVHTHQS